MTRAGGARQATRTVQEHLTAVARPGDPSRRNRPSFWGEFVTRRPLLHIASIAATLLLVIAACSNAASQAPALTDPKEILTQTVASLKDVKTVELVGSLTGKVKAAELGGSLDLSSTTIAGASTSRTRRPRSRIDAPTLLGHEGRRAPRRRLRLRQGRRHRSRGSPACASGKYVKTAIPQASGKPVDEPERRRQAGRRRQGPLDKLPTPPTKLPDEKCGDSGLLPRPDHRDRGRPREARSPTRPRRPTGDVTSTSGPGRATTGPAKLAVSVDDRRDGHVRRHVRPQVRRHGRRRAPRRPTRSRRCPPASPSVARPSPPGPSPERRSGLVDSRSGMRPREGPRPTMTR